MEVHATSIAASNTPGYAWPSCIHSRAHMHVRRYPMLMFTLFVKLEFDLFYPKGDTAAACARYDRPGPNASHTRNPIPQGPTRANVRTIDCSFRCVGEYEGS